MVDDRSVMQQSFLGTASAMWGYYMKPAMDILKVGDATSKAATIVRRSNPPALHADGTAVYTKFRDVAARFKDEKGIEIVMIPTYSSSIRKRKRKVHALYPILP